MKGPTTFHFLLILGACTIIAPNVTSKIEPANDGALCWMEWKKAENDLNDILKTQNNDKSSPPKIKYTIPGPMTLVDVLLDKFYGETKTREMIDDLICCVNKVCTTYVYKVSLLSSNAFRCLLFTFVITSNRKIL